MNMVPAEMIAATSVEYDQSLSRSSMSRRADARHTGILESADKRAGPHDHQEDDAPPDRAELVLNDCVDGSRSGVDVETPRIRTLS